ncbi:hypothetical protein AHAS_Ahas11G0138200 [Arachis hypogaea]
MKDAVIEKRLSKNGGPTHLEKGTDGALMQLGRVGIHPGHNLRRPKLSAVAKGQIDGESLNLDQNRVARARGDQTTAKPSMDPAGEMRGTQVMGQRTTEDPMDQQAVIQHVLGFHYWR